ncbi:hypothetical protein XENTR_v10001211 [Xenopus tropicalis]|nr:hypothetical protein XENTR_v10001211 [Xenopus tropicalis]
MSEELLEQVRAKIASDGADWLQQLLGPISTEQRQGGQAAGSAGKRPACRSRPPSRLSPSPPRASRRTSSAAASQPLTVVSRRQRAEVRTAAQASMVVTATTTNASQRQKPPASDKARWATHRPPQRKSAPPLHSVAPTPVAVPSPTIPPSPGPLFATATSHINAGPSSGLLQRDHSVIEFEEGELPLEELEDPLTHSPCLSPDHIFSTQLALSPSPPFPA